MIGADGEADWKTIIVGQKPPRLSKRNSVPSLFLFIYIYAKMYANIHIYIYLNIIYIHHIYLKETHHFPFFLTNFVSPTNIAEPHPLASPEKKNNFQQAEVSGDPNHWYNLGVHQWLLEEIRFYGAHQPTYPLWKAKGFS